MRTIKEMNEAEIAARAIRKEIKDAIQVEVHSCISACCNQIGLATDTSNKLAKVFAEEVAQKILNAADIQNKIAAWEAVDRTEPKPESAPEKHE